jgi:DNA ligase-associated metallophosphoesterase
MDGLAFDLNGAALRALPEGALWWPAERLLAVADLHFEKGSSFAAGPRRQLIPPYDTRQTLAVLGGLIETLQPQRVICLGDSFHDRKAAERIDPDDAAALAALIDGVDWTWIAGNHDPLPPQAWGGRVSYELAFGELTFRHEAEQSAGPGEVSGHYHPVASLSVRGRGMRRRCFLTDGRRLVLPSFGTYTGGLNALDPAIARLFPASYEALTCGGRAVHRLSSRQLRPDATLA